MNTIVSFACSFSTVFHGFHHHGTAEKKDHSHAGKAAHSHQHSGNHHQPSSSKEEKNDDCCSKNLVAIEKIDKAVSRTINLLLVIFTLSFFNAFYIQHSSPQTLFPTPVAFNRWRPMTTIPDLRIVMQSFQI